MNAIYGRVSKSGRISLPAEFRKAVGLDGGGDVVVELQGSEIRIRTIDEVVVNAKALAQKLLRGKPAATVDGFLADRHAEASRE